MAKESKLKGASLSIIQFRLYALWWTILGAYLAVFFICRLLPSFRKAEVDDAMLRVASVMAPVLFAFLAFWFKDISHANKEDRRRIPTNLVWIVFSATILPHAFVLLYLVAALWTLNYPDSEDQSFVGIVRMSMLFMAVFSTIMTGPAAFVLQQNVVLGDPTGPTKPTTSPSKI